ncbi:MAG: NAD(P)/FAD-dependent oxidoreductase [Thermoleophilia bacterium]|nr:NAD(P)/FAD-dependent oxidoreductase [Thermoleophilia bacterium]
MPGKTIMVLGGGIGGVVAANKLHHLLKNERVTLIDRKPAHSFTGSYVWILNGKRTASQVEKSLSALQKKGIGFTRGEVTAINPKAGKVDVDGKEMGYDYLVVSLGADLDPGAVPGLSRGGVNLFTTDGLTEAHRKLREFSGGRVVIAVTRMPYKCPAAPYEMAMIIDKMLRKSGVRERSEIEIVTWEPQPMPVAGPMMGRAVLSMIEPMGIKFRSGSTITAIDPEEKSVLLENDEPVPFDLLLYVPPHKCAQVVREAGLTGEGGWVPVEPGTLATSHENLYVIGDAAAIKLPNAKMLPKAGVFAHKHAETVAHEIAAAIKGKPAPKPYGGEGSCFLEVGDGTAGYARGNFYADPEPVVKAKKPGRLLHLEKVAFEKYWFWKYL